MSIPRGDETSRGEMSKTHRDIITKDTKALDDDTCTSYGKYCFSQSALNLHTRVRTGDKPYKCETCDKSFTQKVSLKTHMLIHGVDKPYKC